MLTLLTLCCSFGFAGDSHEQRTFGRAPRLFRNVVAARDVLPGWQAIRDRDTGVVVRMWGGYVAVPGAQRDAAIAERAARAFLEAQLPELAPGAKLSDLRLVTNRVDGELRTVAFQQTWRGMRVVGGQLHVVFSHDRLFAAGSDAVPDVRAELPGSSTPAPTRRAEAWLGAAVRSSRERVVLPLIYGPNDIEYRVAEVFEARAGIDHWDVYVATDGTPLLARNRTAHAGAQLRFEVAERRPGDPRLPVPAGDVNLIVDGNAVTTDETGQFAWDGKAPATVELSAAGPRIQLVNLAGSGAVATREAQPGAPLDWAYPTDELEDAQLAAFIYTQMARQRARALTPALAAWLERPLRVHVNSEGECSAGADDDRITFNRGSARCENLARLADVVFHEVGHLAHQNAVIAGVGAFDRTLVEGIADFFATSMTGDSVIGRGFYRTNQGVRELDPPGFEWSFPNDVQPNTHGTGLIIGGALWDLRTALVRELGPELGSAASEQIFVGVMQRASDLPTSYVAALIADDDDGDLGNGTPHLCTIRRAFGRHGLVPEVNRIVVEEPVIDGHTVSVQETTSNDVCPGLVVTGATLAWKVGTSELSTIAMTVDNGTWSATIPTQPDGTVVLYKVTADLDDGSTVTYPSNLADPFNQLYIGQPTPIWCDLFDEDPRFWVRTGVPRVWHWAPPRGQAMDPSAAFSGQAVLGTDLLHDGAYAVGNVHIDIPRPVDTSGYTNPRLQFRRWLTVRDRAYDRAAISINGEVVWENPTDSTTGRLDFTDREWRFVDVPLTQNPVTVRWSMANMSDLFGGWNLDDVCIVGDKIPVCGDQVVDRGEDCDDGNADDGDGCASDCVLEEPGGCCSVNRDPVGGLGLALAVWLFGGRRRRPRIA